MTMLDFIFAVAGAFPAIFLGMQVPRLLFTGGPAVAGFVSGFFVPKDELLPSVKKPQLEALPLVAVEKGAPKLEPELDKQVATNPRDYRLDKDSSRLLASLAKALLEAEKRGIEGGRGEEFRRAQTLRTRFVNNVEAWKEAVDYEGRDRTNYAVFLANLGLIAEQLAEHNRNYKRTGNRKLRTLNSYFSEKGKDTPAKTVA